MVLDKESIPFDDDPKYYLHVNIVPRFTFIICNTRLYTVNKDKCSRGIHEPCIPCMLVTINMIQSIWQIFPNNPDHTIHCKKNHRASTGLFHSKFWYTSRHYFYSFIIFIHSPNAEDFHMQIEKKVAGKYVNEWSPAVVDLALLAYTSSSISS